VHTHSTHAAAVSCLADVDPHDVLPALTAYYVMRVGRLPLLPYHAPGDRSLEELAERTARASHAMLLANHGPVVSAADLASAADAVEELEATARIYLLLHGQRTRPLTPEQVEALRRTRRGGGAAGAPAAPAELRLLREEAPTEGGGWVTGV
jgi:ribulose-5-phosphate 4-epimerase/fuculose-1-phosphate aldolase